MEEENQRLKIAAISGAAHALRFKEKNPNATEQEVIQYVTDLSEEILKNIDEEL